MITGYYDRVNNSAGRRSVNICYYNHVVNLNGGDPNDVTKYTKENYIARLREMMRENLDTLFFVHLPAFQVYDDPEGNPITLVDWWTDIYMGVHGEINLAGFYIADEPEIYGTEYSDQPPYPYFEALRWKVDWYEAMPEEYKFPLLAVFCDVTLLNRKKSYRLDEEMWVEVSELKWWMGFFQLDIFGMDFYPLQTQQQVNSRGLGFQIGTSKEWDWIESQFKSWIPVFSYAAIRPKMVRTMYVGQGCGTRDWNGDPNWGQRNCTAQELRQVFELYKKHLGMPDYHVLWSFSRSDHFMWGETEEYLENILLPIELPRKTRTFLQKIGDFFKRLFSWKN